MPTPEEKDIENRKAVESLERKARTYEFQRKRELNENKQLSELLLEHFSKKSPNLSITQEGEPSTKVQETIPTTVQTNPAESIHRPSESIPLESQSPREQVLSGQTTQPVTIPKTQRNGCFPQMRERARNAKVWMQKHHLWK